MEKLAFEEEGWNEMCSVTTIYAKANKTKVNLTSHLQSSLDDLEVRPSAVNYPLSDLRKTPSPTYYLRHYQERLINSSFLYLSYGGGDRVVPYRQKLKAKSRKTNNTSPRSIDEGVNLLTKMSRAFTGAIGRLIGPILIVLSALAGGEFIPVDLSVVMSRSDNKGRKSVTSPVLMVTDQGFGIDIEKRERLNRAGTKDFIGRKLVEFCSVDTLIFKFDRFGSQRSICGVRLFPLV